MSDYIDRQLAIEVCDWYEHEFVECEYAIRLVADDLKKMPSADVEPTRRGRWVVNKCSSCGFLTTEWIERCHYCPNCGARMDGAQDG